MPKWPKITGTVIHGQGEDSCQGETTTSCHFGNSACIAGKLQLASLLVLILAARCVAPAVEGQHANLQGQETLGVLPARGFAPQKH